ncbi:RDD family protein [Nocardia sp. NPDC003693]
MSRITGSWLSGPNGEPRDEAPGDYQGKDLGLPKSGVGALAPMVRRVPAFILDWFIALGLTAIIVRPNGDALVAKFISNYPDQEIPSRFTLIAGELVNYNIFVWFGIGLLGVTLFGFTPGQYFLRIRVSRVDADAPVGFIRALVRQLILIFVIPALFTDANGRGMHDRATGTGLVYSR